MTYKNTQDIKKGLSPLVSQSSEILILGTSPSDISLKKKEYYANKRNRFWKIIQKIYHERIDTYERKTNVILNNKLSLWDVLRCCKRNGSSDSKIKDEMPNDLEAFLNKHKSIKYIILNGGKADKLYRKYFPNICIKIAVVPSTSGANTGIAFEKLYEEWSKILLVNYSDL